MPEAVWPRPAGLVALAVIASMIGAALRPDPSLVTVMAHGLASVAAYAGALALVVLAAPRLQIPETLAAASVTPIVASGLLLVVPIPGLGLVWTVAGAAFAAWIGGFNQAGVRTALLGMLPPLLVSGLRLALIP